MSKRHRYYVYTWDMDLQKFTTQKGVDSGPYSLWGLRKAIRKLRDMGYPCDYTSRCGFTSDAYVLIERKRKVGRTWQYG